MKANALGVASWMVLWWILEVLPIYITAMLPMVLFPTLGILPLKETFIPYASPIIFLFLGGFLIALALEKRKIHERLAFGIIRLTGTRPKGIILGFMVATASVAMWISNTATAVMMLPIALSVVQLMDEPAKGQNQPRFSMLLMLGIAYAANIGGTITLIGTPPNLVFAGFYFQEMGMEFSFVHWLMIGAPVGITLLLCGYWLLVRFVYPIENSLVTGAKELFDARWYALGKLNRAEWSVIGVFTITVLGWILTNPINSLIGKPVLSTTTVAMFGGLMMFVFPVNLSKGEFILHWEDTVRLPWGIIILFGGGLALASGLEQAGIIDDIAFYITDQPIASNVFLMLSLVLLSIFMTEVMSNVALVTVLLPVVFSIAHQKGIDPLGLTVPVTLAASCAFMMPISTPPNAIVYSSGRISVGQMLKAGVWMNLLSCVVIGIVGWILLQ
ncbi:MAG: DASS family sodium-coupled anion symporter [Salibacteraceae bacterium]